MAKPNTLLKRTNNALLDYIKGLPAEPCAFGSESVLARQFGVSRTTVRAAIETMVGSGILERGSAGLRIMRRPKRTDYYSDSETDGPQEQIERVFMQRVLLGDWRPGQTFSEAELARDSNASTVSVREFLFGFSRFGLIAKQPRGGWIMREFHDGFAAEVADMRELIEMAAMTRMPHAGSAALTEAADAMIARNRDIEAGIARRYTEFAALDRDFHLWIIGFLNNRFAYDFFDIVSFLFHYHYQWDRNYEVERTRVAIAEHMTVLIALRSGAIDKAQHAMDVHLATSRRSLKAGLKRGTT